MKKQYDEDELAIGRALINWINSQDVCPGKCYYVMLGLVATSIGVKATSFKDLKTGINIAQEQLLSNALETYVKEHKCEHL